MNDSTLEAVAANLKEYFKTAMGTKDQNKKLKYVTINDFFSDTFKSGDSPSLTYQRHRYLGRLPYPFPPFCEPDEKELAKKEDILVYPGMIMVKVTLKSQEQHRACSPGTDTLFQLPRHQTRPLNKGGDMLCCCWSSLQTSDWE